MSYNQARLIIGNHYAHTKFVVVEASLFILSYPRATWSDIHSAAHVVALMLGR